MCDMWNRHKKLPIKDLKIDSMNTRSKRNFKINFQSKKISNNCNDWFKPAQFLTFLFNYIKSQSCLQNEYFLIDPCEMGSNCLTLSTEPFIFVECVVWYDAIRVLNSNSNSNSHLRARAFDLSVGALKTEQKFAGAV